MDIKALVEQLKLLALISDKDTIRKELAHYRSEDLAEGFQRISVEEGLKILRLLDSETASEILIELPTDTARQYLEELPDRTLAHYLDILPMDDALELQEILEPERFEALLQVIPSEDANELRRLMAYPDDSVGRMMTEAFFEVGPDLSMEEVLADIRRSPEGKYEMVNDIYVLDARRRLLGVFSLRRAIRARPEVTAKQVMNTDVVTCQAESPAEEAARTMSRYGFYALPVLDRFGRMVGLFTGDDAQEVLEEADTEDLLKLGAVTGGTDAYLSLGPMQLVKRRVPWLMALFVAETLTGEVMRHYARVFGNPETNPTYTTDLYASLVVFVPLLIGVGGNCGSQVTTTITRSLALGEVRSHDWLRVMRRELTAATLTGAFLGFLGALRAYYGWGSGFNVSLIVGLALPMIVIWAGTIGSLLPISAKRIGIDPAVMSAPFITTFVDATGLIIFFEIAQRLISR